MMRNKKAGFEMSITTLVVIVIAVVMLILGLVLVQRIFRGATESVSVMQAGMMDKMRGLFEKEGGTISMFTRTFNVRPGTRGFQIPIGFQTKGGDTVAAEGMKFTIEVLPGGARECGVEEVKRWIESPRITKEPSDAFTKVEGNVAGLDIVISVPEDTPYCTQLIKVNVYFKDKPGEIYSSDTITLNIVRGGLFG